MTPPNRESLDCRFRLRKARWLHARRVAELDLTLARLLGRAADRAAAGATDEPRRINCPVGACIVDNKKEPLHSAADALP